MSEIRCGQDDQVHQSAFCPWILKNGITKGWHTSCVIARTANGLPPSPKLYHASSYCYIGP
eukprot:2972130-Amphidinium_carterae.1